MEAIVHFTVLSGKLPEHTKEFHEQPYNGDVRGIEVQMCLVLNVKHSTANLTLFGNECTPSHPSHFTPGKNPTTLEDTINHISL